MFSGVNPFGGGGGGGNDNKVDLSASNLAIPVAPILAAAATA